MSKVQPAQPGRIRNAPIWLKVFVAFHLVCITMWSLPYPKKPYMNGTAQFGVDTSSADRLAQSVSESVTEGILYLNWKHLKGSPLMYYPGCTGFWQYWDMFSPNPASVDLYMEADVLYKDGSKYRYHYPRIKNLPIPVKYVKERYRKFFENANSNDNAYARPFVAQRVALECYKDPANPPVQVTLIRFFYQIAAPGQPQPEKYTEVPFYSYAVDQQKLKKDMGVTN